MVNYIKKNDCGNCSLKLNLFCYLSDDQLNRINRTRQEVQYSAGETIFKSGGPLTHIICITKGLVKVYLESESENEKKILMSLVKPVQLIGGPGFLVDNRHHLTVTAVENTEACFIDTNEYKNIMLNNPEFSMELVRYLNMRIIQSYNKMNDLVHKHMHGKLATTLLYLADQIYNCDKFETRLTRQDIADLSAMTKESVIRILKEFKDDGILKFSTTHFDILKKESLIQISKNG